MEFPNLSGSTPPVKDATTPNATPHTIDLKREHGSVDDFEHLEISPSKEKSNSFTSDPLLDLGTDKDLSAPSNICSQPNLLDQSNNFHPFSQPDQVSSKDFFPGMNENSMFSSKKEPVNDFLKELSSENASSSVGFEVSKFLEAETGFKKPETADISDFSKFSMDNTSIYDGKDASKKDTPPSEFGSFKHDEALGHDFLNETSSEANLKKQPIDVTPDKSPSKIVTPEPLSKSDTPEPPAKSVTPEPPAKSVTPEPPAKSATPEPPAKSVTPEPPAKSVTPEPPAHFNQTVKEDTKTDPFDLMNEKYTASQIEPEVPSESISQFKPDPIVKHSPVSNTLESSETIKPIADKNTDSVADFVAKEKTPPKLPEHKAQKPSRNTSDDSELIQVDEVFRRIGLDSWFKPETLHPQVEALVYWRDPKKSGVVFGTILVALLSLTYYSFISVVAYFSLIILCGTISFKIYKSILQAVQKTSDGHPFKEILELELTLPQDKVREFAEVGVTHVNAAIIELRRLFLVEDLVDSIKFAVLLWLLTRVGAWFNGMTLIIIAFIALFSLPKVYENNKAQVDANLAIVQSKLQEITTKVKAALPIGKKEAEKDKEQ